MGTALVSLPNLHCWNQINATGNWNWCSSTSPRPWDVSRVTNECNAEPVQCQTYDYLPSHKASPPIRWYQIILLDDRGRCVNNLPMVALECRARLWLWLEIRLYFWTFWMCLWPTLGEPEGRDPLSGVSALPLGQDVVTDRHSALTFLASNCIEISGRKSTGECAMETKSTLCIFYCLLM